MNPVTQSEKIRFQIELTPERLRIVEDLMHRSGIETRKDFFNTTITAFAWLLDETEKGNEVAAVDRKRQRFDVLRMTELEFARRRAAENNPLLSPQGVTNKK